MRLKTIRLAGFKSFVDPTTIPINASMIGVVGPNGCGKSNIIDAVRWVMGEMSAKNLRGDSMADVIFNGSNARKPVGKAMVELVFDNTDGGAGGQYAAYNEISIRREASRDGTSDYFLNKTRCRRKDITDLFLGTGLGPRAYSIIEQGMVTRIIEAKPEDLRGFIEEAAGISRYKERRRETETRIRHTQENLARVEDIRKELQTQLNRLDKQSKAAAKYKELKTEERRLRAQLFALRFRELDEKFNAQDTVIREQEIALEAAVAAQREIEAAIERKRSEHAEALDAQNAVQAEYYSIGAEISRLEQAIEHARETREALKREQEQLDRAWAEAETHLGADRAQIADLTQKLEGLSPQLSAFVSERDTATAALRDAERAMQAWQEEWESVSATVAEASKSREIQTARIRQLESHVAQLRERLARMQEESSAIEVELKAAGLDAARDEARALDEACEALEQALRQNAEDIQRVRTQRDEQDRALSGLRGEQQSAEARLASLRELQAAAEAKHDAGIAEWLRSKGLEQAARLGNLLHVDAGWETAVERVLGARLAAVCANNLNDVTAGIGDVKPAQLTILDLAAPRAEAPNASGSLLEKVRSDIDLGPLLAGVYAAQSLDDAMARRGSLAAHESFVTPAGEWVGRNWLSVAHASGNERGWIARQREIETIEQQCNERATRIESVTAQLSEARTQLSETEARREQMGRELNERQRARAERRERLGHEQERLSQLESRSAKIGREHQELQAQLTRDEGEIEAARELLRQAESDSGVYEERRAALQAKRQSVQDSLSACRDAETNARERAHKLEIEQRTLQTSLESTRASIARLQHQMGSLGARREELTQLLANDHEPEAELKIELNAYLEKRLAVEERLSQARQVTSEIDSAMRAHEQQRHQAERHAQQIREGLESQRVAREELRVRRDTIVDQLREAGADVRQVLAELPAEAAEAPWQEQLDTITARIERLGPINLVAIEEFEELSQRKGYLDKQSDDLNEALKTLQEAIQKMDGETKTRFRDTFNKVNDNFQAFFPRLFGGGSAYLELTDNNLLETGVSVMARPPGKRNSTIHLLSGGEKALTAVALLFSIFELNPAPFCLLDEVDAPLDDANVERYAQTLKTMSERTQLLYITHNKISMEMAEVLLGVTMSEPGVSRLVAVDVEEAMQMAAQ